MQKTFDSDPISTERKPIHVHWLRNSVTLPPAHPFLWTPHHSSMGLSFSSLFTSLASLIRWSKDQDVRILMLGLDSAGKVLPTYICLSEITSFTFGLFRRQFFTNFRYAGSPWEKKMYILMDMLQIGEVLSTIPSESQIVFLEAVPTEFIHESHWFQCGDRTGMPLIISLTRALTLVFKYKNIKFQVWDLGGQSSIR